MVKLPGVNHLDAVRAFKKVGYRVLRQGKHNGACGGKMAAGGDCICAEITEVAMS
jgi:hypothetical protein